MNLKKCAVTAATAALAVALVGAPGTANAADPDMAADLAAATVETESVNAQHYASLAAQVGNNITCRAEKPVFVSQPEVDGRVTVKGEDTAVTAITCADATLNATNQILGRLYIEFQKPDRSWELITATNTQISGRMLRGAGTAPGAVDYIYEANDESQGRPHRACVEGFAPNVLAPLCSVFATLEKTTV